MDKPHRFSNFTADDIRDIDNAISVLQGVVLILGLATAVLTYREYKRYKFTVDKSNSSPSTGA